MRERHVAHAHAVEGPQQRQAGPDRVPGLQADQAGDLGKERRGGRVPSVVFGKYYVYGVLEKMYELLLTMIVKAFLRQNLVAFLV